MARSAQASSPKSSRWRSTRVRTNKMRSGADGARRRHRHHVDRRHDGADPRLRPVAARHASARSARTRSSSSGSASRSFAAAPRFRELLKRPNLSISDARAIEEQADHAAVRRRRAGRGGGPADAARGSSTGSQNQARWSSSGTSEFFAEGTRIPMLGRPFLQRQRNCSTGATSSSLATAPYQTAVRAARGSIRSARRCGSATSGSTVVGVFGKRPSRRRVRRRADDFVVDPVHDLSSGSSALRASASAEAPAARS